MGAVELGSYEAAHNALMATEGNLSKTLIEEAFEAAGVALGAAARPYDTNRGRCDGFMTRNAQQAAAFGFQGTPFHPIGTRI